MKMKSFTILILGVGMSIFLSGTETLPDGASNSKQSSTGKSNKWIGEWEPSNKQTKIYVDGQHRVTIRSGGTSGRESIYIRSDDKDTWKRFRVEDD